MSGDIWDDLYPPDKRFVVSFFSEHKLIDGGSCFQDQRRYVLADSGNDAREFVRLGELANVNIWDGEFHKWSNLQVNPCPQACAYPGYPRFGRDIRKTKDAVTA